MYLVSGLAWGALAVVVSVSAVAADDYQRARDAVLTKPASGQNRNPIKEKVTARPAMDRGHGGFSRGNPVRWLQKRPRGNGWNLRTGNFRYWPCAEWQSLALEKVSDWPRNLGIQDIPGFTPQVASGSEGLASAGSNHRCAACPLRPFQIGHRRQHTTFSPTRSSRDPGGQQKALQAILGFKDTRTSLANPRVGCRLARSFALAGQSDNQQQIVSALGKEVEEIDKKVLATSQESNFGEAFERFQPGHSHGR